jgi:polyketide biosynthesis enoyl-CoA hydratase PksI
MPMNNENNNDKNNDNVIKLKKEGAIAVIAMEEREYGNTFTQRFITGLKGAFAKIRGDAEIKVIIVHGYDNYFCCGGTKEELRELYEGYANIGKKVSFTDAGFHDLFLQSELPVIAAMQGHALGAGLAWGCTADFIIMGEQSIYSANFMKYGFTPGFGATYTIPKRFGDILGNEMLFTAGNYYGRELKERGAPVRIVPKQDVIPTAFRIANDLADKPLFSLKVLKKHLIRQISTELPEMVEKELEMHAATFNQPEVQTRIEQLFGN